jgi:hypothetical protein
LGVDRQTNKAVELSSRNKRQMQESILGLVGLLKEKTVYKEDLQAKTVHKALQQVLGKQDVSF